MPLTATKVVPEELLGGGKAPARAPAVDATATRVLTKGEPIPAASGRADDFSWPRGSAVEPQPAVAEPTAAPAATPATATAPATAKPAAKPTAAAPAAGQRPATDAQAAQTTQSGQVNQANPTAEQKPPPPRRPRTNADAPRPPFSIQGLFR